MKLEEVYMRYTYIIFRKFSAPKISIIIYQKYNIRAQRSHPYKMTLNRVNDFRKFLILLPSFPIKYILSTSEITNRNNHL